MYKSRVEKMGAWHKSSFASVLVWEIQLDKLTSSNLLRFIEIIKKICGNYLRVETPFPKLMTILTIGADFSFSDDFSLLLYHGVTTVSAPDSSIKKKYTWPRIGSTAWSLAG